MSAAITEIRPEFLRDELTLTIRFEREASEGKRPRFYELRVDRNRQLTFTGDAAGFVLVVVRGALNGRRSTTRTESFATLLGAVERFGHLSTERRQRGYHEARRL
jgi:predicted DNA-binding WGR domain protein